MTKYQCVECGSKVERLYRDYKAGIIKISHCKSCNAVADKYIEYDPVVIFLDALLLQPQAYRHLLINTHFESDWRLLLLLWVCDAFIKLVLQRAEMASKKSPSESINYSYIGLELYFNFITAAIELVTLLFFVLVVYAIKSLWEHKNFTSVGKYLITKAVIVASLGRILAIPALLWGQPYNIVYQWLCQSFVCLSTLQALRVVTQNNSRTSWAVLAVCIGFTAQMLVSRQLNHWIDYGFT